MSHPLTFLLLTTFSLLISSSRPSPDEEQVKAHILRVGQKILCSTPQPRVIVVESLEERADPPATILHRCGPSTGCCYSLAEECVAKRKERVPLYFSVGPHQVGGSSGGMEVKVKLMSNHTECHCVKRSARREKRMERRVKRRKERCMRRRAMRGDGKGL